MESPWAGQDRFSRFLQEGKSFSPAVRRLIRKLTTENLWLHILALIKDGPIYGYEFPRLIKERFGFKPNKVTCYAVLYLLKNEGLIRGEKRKEGPRPAKVYYHITQMGLSELEVARRILLSLLRELGS